MQQSLAAPDTCVYYQVASVYHDFAAAVRQVSPALFDLVEGYTLATFRRNERELKATQHSVLQFIHTGKMTVRIRLMNCAPECITSASWP